MTPTKLPLEVAPRAVLALGEELVRDDRAALEELVKNAYDADARNVRVVFELEDSQAVSLSIVDDGNGMSLEEVQTRWLVVASSHKRGQARSPDGRVMTGQKGIGRLATARLGRVVEIATRSSSSKPLVFSLDWSHLESLETLSQFRVSVAEDADRLFDLGVSETGTCVHITELKRQWALCPEGSEDLSEIETALAKILSPFSHELQLRLTIELISNGEILLAREIATPDVLEHPHYQLVGSVRADGTLEATYLRSGRTAPLETQGVRVPTLNIKECGVFSFDYRVWDRDRSVLLDEARRAGLSVGDREIRETLNSANGLFVYRDGFLAFPKRDEDRDWLGLAAWRVDNPTARIGLNQLVAGVFISREFNPAVRDKSDREGFVQSTAVRDLKRAVKTILEFLEARRLLDKPAMGTARTSPHREVHIDSLTTLSKELRAGRADPKEAAEQIERESQRLSGVQKSLQNRMAGLARLAAVGQLAGVLVHEIGNQLPILSEALRKGRAISVKGGDITGSLAAAESAVRTIQRIVQRYSPYFVGGTRTRRRASDLFDVVVLALESREKALRASQVELDAPPRIEGVRVKVDSGDILAAVGNIIDNAIYWATQGESGKAKIRVRIKVRDGFGRVTVSDSGPGVDDDLVDRVFEPGFTLRRGGMGLGLSVARDVVVATGGTLQLEPRSRLGGARLVIDFPLESE